MTAELCTVFDSPKSKKELYHFKHGRPSEAYPYCNEKGEVLFYLCRFELENSKEFAPMTQWKSSDGRLQIKPRGYSGKLPLYNLPEIMQYPEARIVICEGEKAADAARKFFSVLDYVTTTTAFGANAANRTDLTPLLRRKVILWPDNDEAGDKYMRGIAKHLGVS